MLPAQAADAGPAPQAEDLDHQPCQPHVVEREAIEAGEEIGASAHDTAVAGESSHQIDEESTSEVVQESHVICWFLEWFK